MLRKKELKLVGQDPSLRNWGIAHGTYCLDSKKLQITKLKVICPDLPTGKQIRQNSLDMESSKQLYTHAALAAMDAHATFVEVPVGSQSARAMASYAMCVGVLGAMQANKIAFFPMTANEVKLAGAGKATATKKEMITWAIEKHPEAVWPMYRKNGKDLVSETQAEHMADAIAAIYAGIASNQFQQMLSLMAAQP